MTQATLRETELGIEKRCPRCTDWWPLDETFWFRYLKRGRPAWSSQCRACCNETKAERRRRQMAVA